MQAPNSGRDMKDKGQSLILVIAENNKRFKEIVETVLSLSADDILAGRIESHELQVSY